MNRWTVAVKEGQMIRAIVAVSDINIETDSVTPKG
jgi:hypothetical protein